MLCVYRFVDSDTLNLTVDNETVQLHRAGSGAVSAPGGDEPSSPFGGGADTPTSLNDITGSWSTLLDGSEVSFIYGADGSFTAVLDGENVQGSYTVSNGVVSMTSSDGDLQELPYSFNNDGTLLLLGLGSTNEDGYLVLQGENGSPAGALRGTDFIGDWESDAGYTVLFDDSSMSTSDDDNFLCSFVGDGLLLYFSGAGMIFSYEFEDPDTLMLTYGDEVEYLYRVGSR